TAPPVRGQKPKISSKPRSIKAKGSFVKSLDECPTRAEGYKYGIASGPSKAARQLTRLKHLVSRSVSSSSSAHPSQAARQLTRPKYLASRPVSSSLSSRPSQAARQLTRPKYLVCPSILSSSFTRPSEVSRRLARPNSPFIYNQLVLTPSVLVEEIILCNPSNSPKSRARINRKIFLPSLEIPFSYLCDSCINSWRARDVKQSTCVVSWRAGNVKSGMLSKARVVSWRAGNVKSGMLSKARVVKCLHLPIMFLGTGATEEDGAIVAKLWQCELRDVKQSTCFELASWQCKWTLTAIVINVRLLDFPHRFTGALVESLVGEKLISRLLTNVVSSSGSKTTTSIPGRASHSTSSFDIAACSPTRKGLQGTIDPIILGDDTSSPAVRTITLTNEEVPPIKEEHPITSLNIPTSLSLAPNQDQEEKSSGERHLENLDDDTTSSAARTITSAIPQTAINEIPSARPSLPNQLSHLQGP
ncbi:putative protein, partial [Arabidopsis thaliana]